MWAKVVMIKIMLRNQRLTGSIKKALPILAICALLSSCAPLSNHPAAAPRPSGKSTSYLPRKSHLAAKVSLAKKSVQAPETVFGLKVPQALSFSRLTRLFSGKDESLDQVPAALPEFPTVAQTQVSEEAIDSAAIEDERSLLLLSEADRFAEFSQNKTLTEIARGSLSRSMELVAPTQKAKPYKLPHKITVILALCIAVLITCGYFVISYLLEDLRVRNTPKFGSH